MQDHASPNSAQQGVRTLRRLVSPLTLALICGSLAFGTPALAQTEEPVPTDLPGVTEAPPTDPPAPEPTNPPAPEPTDSPAPTAPPVTVEPTSAPTDEPVPATEAPTSEPTSAPPDIPASSPAATATPTPTSSATAQVWVNHDALDGSQAGATALQPGETHQVQVGYAVTTPRHSTTIHAELRDSNGNPATGWQLRIVSLDGVGDDWTAAGPVADQAETTTTAPNTTFTLTLFMRAPATITVAESVTLVIHSSVTTQDGAAETGITSDAPIAGFQVEPPPPTPTPTPVSCDTEAVNPDSDSAPLSRSLPSITTSGAAFGAGESDGSSYPSLTTRLLVTVSLPDGVSCLLPGWTVTIVASAMTTDDGGLIPATSITYQGVTGLDAPGLDDTGISPGTSLDVPQPIVHGTSQTLDPVNSSTTFGVIVDLSPPPDAPAGDYRGTIVVDSSAAP